MKAGDFVNIDYVASVKSSGELFDFTLPEIAKKMGREGDFKPVTIVIGARHVIPGLDDELTNHKVGDEFDVDIPPEKAFGKRSPKLMQLIPRNKFRKDNINPIPGMRITVNNLPGTVRSASGGRIIVDFNHPLAGKVIHYWVKINKKITSKKEKIESLLKYHGLEDFKTRTTKESVTIVSEQLSDIQKAALKKEFERHMKIKNVKFEAKKQTKSK